MNVSLIGLCVVVFFYQLSLHPRDLNLFLLHFGFVPQRFILAGSWKHVSLLELVYPLFTSMFLHGGWLHLLGNMLYLWIFGDNVEDRLGHLKYFCFYIICGVAAALTQLIFHPTSTLPMVGASGAIAGVLGGYFILFPHSRVVALVPIWFFIQVIEIPAFFFLIFWFLMQFLNGLSSLSRVVGGVAWWAHIGGFLSGVILIYLFPQKKLREEREWL